MAENREIRTISYVHRGEAPVDTASLSEGQRQELAAWLKSTYLNALLRGRAVIQKGGGRAG